MEAYRQIVDIKNNTLNLHLPEVFKNGKVEVIILSLEEQQDQKKRKPSEFRGCISKNNAFSILKNIEDSRKEWNRDI